MDFYDGDKKVKKEDYHLYKDFFTVNEDGSIRFAPEMGTIRYSQEPKPKTPLVFPYEGPFIDSLYGTFELPELPESSTEMTDAAQAKKAREQALKDRERAKKEMERNKQENDLLWKELKKELVKDGYLKENQQNFEITIIDK